MSAAPDPATIPPDEPLGACLRRGRRAAGLTQAALGAALGRPQSVIARWEAGRLEPTQPDLRAAAACLGVPLEAFLAAPGGAPPRRRSRRGRDRAAAQAWGAALRAARRAAGFDPVTLARRTHLTARRLRQLEAGADPSLAELRRLRAVLAELDGATLARAGLLCAKNGW